MSRLREVAQQIALEYARLPEVEAVVLAGSVGGGHADSGSDIDLYVYADVPIFATDREVLVRRRASAYALENRFWEDGDEWIEAESGTAVDVMYRNLSWIDDQVQRVLVMHEGSVGYSTCFWYNVLHSEALFDRMGWYASLQVKARQPYPEALVKAIIAKNQPLLNDLLFSAYSHQLEKAVSRGDLVSINHRVGAVLASYFDILWAVNRLPHPGEKRLINLTEAACSNRPVNMRKDVETLLQAAGVGDKTVLEALDLLVSHLDEFLVAEALLPATHNVKL